MNMSTRWLIILLSLFVSLNLMMFPCKASGFTGAQAKNEKFINAIWYNVYKIDLSDEANAKKQIDEQFKKFFDLKISRIYFLVKHPDGRVYFKSKFAIQACEWDPFDYIIKKCRNYKMEIYPYLNIFAEEGFYLQKYPQFAELRKDGTVLNWASPAVHQVRERMLGMIREIIKHYKVDGLQLDRIRYPGYADVGYNAESIKLFEEKFYKKPQPDDPDFVQFRNDLITSFVAQAAQVIKHYNRSLKVSAAVFHTPSIAQKDHIFQQWDLWVAKGMVDEVCPMSYTADPEKFSEYVRENSETISQNNSKTKLIMGIGAYLDNMKPESLQRQFDLVNSEPLAAGVCYFNGYSILEDNLYQVLKSIDLKKRNYIGIK